MSILSARFWILPFVALTTATLVACGGGLESEECVAYFKAVDECAEKAGGIKADALRKGAEISRENFKKNSNPMAVSKSCEMMLETIKKDPACK